MEKVAVNEVSERWIAENTIRVARRKKACDNDLVEACHPCVFAGSWRIGPDGQFHRVKSESSVDVYVKGKVLAVLRKYRAEGTIRFVFIDKLFRKAHHHGYRFYGDGRMRKLPKRSFSLPRDGQ